VVSATFTRTVDGLVESTIVVIDGDHATFRHLTDGLEVGRDEGNADSERVLSRVSALLAEGYIEAQAFWTDSEPVPADVQATPAHRRLNAPDQTRRRSLSRQSF
jgi:hypothetical protein